MIRLQATDADAPGNGPPFTWEVLEEVTPQSAVARAGVAMFNIDQDGTVRLASLGINRKVSYRSVKARLNLY